MNLAVAKKLIKFVNSTCPDEVVFGLREIVKRLMASEENVKLFRSMQILPVILAVIPTNSTKIIDYVCIILSRYIDDDSISEFLESEKLTFFTDHFSVANVERKCVRSICIFISHMAANHKEFRQSLYKGEVLNDITVGLDINKNEQEVIDLYIKVIRNLTVDQSDCEAMMEHPCIRKMHEVGLNKEFSDKSILQTLKTISKQLHTYRYIQFIRVINNSTHDFQDLACLFERTSQISEVLMKIAAQIMDICKPRITRAVVLNRGHILVQKLILAEFPSSCTKLLKSSNKTLKAAAFDLLIRMFHRTVHCSVYLWAQFDTTGGFQSFLSFLESPDVENGMTPHDIRLQILSTLLTNNGEQVYRWMANKPKKDDILPVLLPLFEEYVQIAAEKWNMPRDLSANISACSLHVTERDIAKDNKCTILAREHFLSYCDCMNIIGSLLKLMALVGNNDGTLDTLKNLISILASYLTTAPYIFPDVFAAIFKYLDQPQLKWVRQEALIRSFILPKLFNMETQGSECKSCIRITDGMKQLAHRINNYVVENPPDTLPIDEYRNLFFITFPLCEESVVRLSLYSRKFKFIRGLLENSPITDLKFSLQALFYLKTSGLAYKNSLDEPLLDRLMQKLYCVFELGKDSFCSQKIRREETDSLDGSKASDLFFPD